MISFFELFKVGIGPSSSRDIVFDFERVFAGHSNAMTLAAFDRCGQLLEQETWYSIGGGFVVRGGDRTDARGLSVEGLPRVLKVQRRANGLLERPRDRTLLNARAPHESLEVVKVYAIAMNEENAAGGRIVTAPTNGAAGVIPAVLKYYRDYCLAESEVGIRDFLLTATAIGSLCKMNASISGADVSCQGEVGVACSMAAAGLMAALGGAHNRVENAAEIGIEHHLGMTGDPIGGLVQIPCVERNAFGAVKAIKRLRLLSVAMARIG